MWGYNGMDDIVEQNQNEQMMTDTMSHANESVSPFGPAMFAFPAVLGAVIGGAMILSLLGWGKEQG